MLTAEQKADLKLAIERAKEPGACRYQRRGEPVCVIGQLLAIRGVKLDASFDRGSLGVDVLVDRTRRAVSVGDQPPRVLAAAALGDFDINLLNRLQVAWDCCTNPARAADCRARMIEMVDAA